MSIHIGGAVGGRYSRPIEGITCYENRCLQNLEHKYFWQDAEFCLKNNIYLIVNIDSYLTNSRWMPDNITLRNFVIDTKTKLKKLGANKNNCRFTIDNESDEYCTFEYYINLVRVVHDALNGEFDLGAGNFRTQSKDWYENLAKRYSLKEYEVFDFHMQDGLNEATEISSYVQWIANLKNTYGIKRIAVTEGNNFYDVTTLHGHNMLKCQINYAESIGCECFCFPYVNWMHNGEESDNDMAYNWNYNPVSDYWEDMLNFINDKKPVQRSNGMIIKTIGHKASDIKSGYGCLLLNEVLNYLGYLQKEYINFTYSSYTRKALEDFQTDVKSKYNITVDGRCGRMTWRYLFREIKDIEVKKEFKEDFEIIMSPYNTNGDT